MDAITPLPELPPTREPEALRDQVGALWRQVQRKAERARSRFHFSNPDAQSSCDNLLAYLALREHDLQDLQLQLAEQGLSSLGRLEGWVLQNLQRVLGHVGGTVEPTTLHTPDLAEAGRILAQRSTLLLGRPRPQHHTRIMVTMAPDIVGRPELIEQLLRQGMDIARINCAHDSAVEWNLIITAIREAEARLTLKGEAVGRRCRIFMDLGGPKVRTGPMRLATRPLKLRVEKDPSGRPVRMLEGFLDAEATVTQRLRTPGQPDRFVIAVSPAGGVTNLFLGDELSVTDTRGRRRTFRVLERLTPTRLRIGLERTTYLDEGMELTTSTAAGLRIGPVMPQPMDIRVQAGHRLRIYRDPTRLGHAADGADPAGISCTLPEALTAVKPGHRICIDDGKITTVVRTLHPDYIEVDVTAPHDIAAAVRAEKGLNFPDSTLDIPAFTAQDREDLRFVAQHATAVGLSFAHRPEDMVALQEALAHIGAPELGLVIKIETQTAIHRLAQLLLTGLTFPRFGVMIARGDLAVEVGFEHLALVQEDILCLCEAAHVPVIWATQVLEGLAKNGLPARAEITDAAGGQRAECVMLNKGRYVLDAVKVLADLLSSRERQRMKKRYVFRNITVQQGIFEPEE